MSKPGESSMVGLYAALACDDVPVTGYPDGLVNVTRTFIFLKTLMMLVTGLYITGKNLICATLWLLIYPSSPFVTGISGHNRSDVYVSTSGE